MENLKYSEILKQNNLLGKYVDQLKAYNISVLSNITCNQLENVLSYNLRKAGLNPIIKIGIYDNIIQDSYNCANEQMVIIHYDLLNTLNKFNKFNEANTSKQENFLFNSIKSDIDLILENLKFAPIVVFNTFSADAIYTNSVDQSKTSILAKELNEYLYSKKSTNLQIFDINVTHAKVGLTNTFDFRMFYLSKALYTISFWKEYVYEISSIVYRYTGKLKKAIIFDCDNTLWNGILGEDGIKGIDMSIESKVGQVFNKIQQIAVWLSEQGVIIGLCSKNNLDDVENVLNEHEDMRLTKESIVISKVNWLDKATNLRAISKELNIGLDSLVFVDDSSFEINLIKEQIPEILAMQVPVLLHEYPEQLLKLVRRNFYLSGNKSDIEKTEQYKAQSFREEEKQKHQSLEDYLASINIEILIKEDDVSQISRIAQLTQKTNQFNLTTKRYTENQIEAFINSEKDKVFSVHVNDKFGESGLTAVIITNEDKHSVNIDSFIMSCRIMGRNIEKAIMNQIIDIYLNKGFTEVRSVYFSTIKNKPVISFYENSGFNLLKKENEDKFYNLKILEYVTQKIEYIKIKN
jgi:FkbH-like protein